MKLRHAGAAAIAFTMLAFAVDAASASAATVYAGPAASSLGFLTSSVSVSAGGSLSFANYDIVSHDVTSTETYRPKRRKHHRKPRPQPLFRSATIGFGRSAPVVGLERAKPGAHPFICSIHPNMTGTITVR